MSEPEKDVLIKAAFDDWMREGGRIPSMLPVVDGKPVCVEVRSKEYIQAFLSRGYFEERDGMVWCLSTGALIVEDALLPTEPPKNYPPKPETAFWRGAPRRKK